MSGAIEPPQHANILIFQPPCGGDSLSIWRSALSTRVLVTLLALAAGVLAFYQAIALSDLDSEFPLAGVVGYAPLLLGVYGGAIALFFAWRPQKRQLGDMAGTVVKTMGDGILMQFKEAQAAVEAVQALSSAFHAALLPLGLPDGRLRTGIHYGLVATGRDGDLFGGAVKLASRLERVAEPGPIVLSQTAAEHVEDEIELEDLGERALKNVARPVRCWAIRA